MLLLKGMETCLGHVNKKGGILYTAHLLPNNLLQKRDKMLKSRSTAFVKSEEYQQCKIKLVHK